MHFEENMIPKEVWDFVKRNTSNIISAGILALIIWRFLKKNKKTESFNEASTNIKPFLDVADSLKSLNEVTTWVRKNNFDKHGHCQNIAALYAYVSNKYKGIATGGHIAYLDVNKVYDPIYFFEVPINKEEWVKKFPVNKEVNLIKLKIKESYIERLEKLYTEKFIESFNIGSKVQFIDHDGNKKIGKIKYYNRNQSGEYSIDVDGSVYHNIRKQNIKEL